MRRLYSIIFFVAAAWDRVIDLSKSQEMLPSDPHFEFTIAQMLDPIDFNQANFTQEEVCLIERLTTRMQVEKAESYCSLYTNNEVEIRKCGNGKLTLKIANDEQQRANAYCSLPANVKPPTSEARVCVRTLACNYIYVRMQQIIRFGQTHPSNPVYDHCALLRDISSALSKCPSGDARTTLQQDLTNRSNAAQCPANQSSVSSQTPPSSTDTSPASSASVPSSKSTSSPQSTESSTSTPISTLVSESSSASTETMPSSPIPAIHSPVLLQMDQPLDPMDKCRQKAMQFQMLYHLNGYDNCRIQHMILENINRLCPDPEAVQRFEQLVKNRLQKYGCQGQQGMQKTQ